MPISKVSPRASRSRSDSAAIGPKVRRPKALVDRHSANVPTCWHLGERGTLSSKPNHNGEHRAQTSGVPSPNTWFGQGKEAGLIAWIGAEWPAKHAVGDCLHH